MNDHAANILGCVVCAVWHSQCVLLLSDRSRLLSCQSSVSEWSMGAEKSSHFALTFMERPVICTQETFILFQVISRPSCPFFFFYQRSLTSYMEAQSPGKIIKMQKVENFQHPQDQIKMQTVRLLPFFLFINTILLFRLER